MGYKLKEVGLLVQQVSLLKKNWEAAGHSGFIVVTPFYV